MLRTLFREYCEQDIQISEVSMLPTCKTVEIECIGSFSLDSATGECIIYLNDSPGYGDFINNQSAIDNIRTYLLDAHKRWVTIDGNKLSEQVCRILSLLVC